MQDKASLASRIPRNTLPELLVPFLVAGFFASLLVLAGWHNVNWDEFYFLSQVHDWLAGRLDRPMQTFFVHGFGWLAWVSTDEMQQIHAARLVMTAILAATCGSIHRIAARLTDPASASIAVLAFLSSGYVLPHGASFRADPIAASLLMGALALMMTTSMRLWQGAVFAVLSALAVLVTVKAIFYLPVFLGALIYRRRDGSFVRRCLVAALVAMILATAAYAWHSSLLTVTVGNDTLSRARDALETAVLTGQLLPRARYSAIWLLLSLPAVLLCLAGLRKQNAPGTATLLVAFCLPVLSLLFYRNAFPYFFPFIVPPMMVVTAFGASALRRSGRFGLIISMILALGGLQGWLAAGESNRLQKATLDEVHRLFPKPVPYIEGYGLVSSFHNQSFFMSSWGIERYQKAEKPVFADIIAESQPPLLIASRMTMIHALSTRDSLSNGLFPEDQRSLRESYVHYAGPIWLAGRSFVGTGAEVTIAIHIAGDYRLVAGENVQIDDHDYSTGSNLALSVGEHRFRAPKGALITLIWAAGGLSADPPDLPSGLVYSEFWTF